MRFALGAKFAKVGAAALEPPNASRVRRDANTAEQALSQAGEECGGAAGDGAGSFPMGGGMIRTCGNNINRKGWSGGRAFPDLDPFRFKR